MKIGRLNRASFAKTARRAMFLFAFAVLGTQAAMVAKVGETAYETLEAAIAAAEPVDGVVTYEICGKAEVSATGWIQVLKSGLSNVKKVAFVGKTEDAEICIAGDLAILADQQYDIDVSFRNLKLSKPIFTRNTAVTTATARTTSRRGSATRARRKTRSPTKTARSPMERAITSTVRPSTRTARSRMERRGSTTCGSTGARLRWTVVCSPVRAA